MPSGSIQSIPAVINVGYSIPAAPNPPYWNTEKIGDTVSITCEAALVELLGYTTRLRSMTQGRGQFSTRFERFDTV
jgi:hypothetical protein